MQTCYLSSAASASKSAAPSRVGFRGPTLSRAALALRDRSDGRAAIGVDRSSVCQSAELLSPATPLCLARLGRQGSRLRLSHHS